MSDLAVMTKAPCAKCPFRKDVPIYLRRARRVEISEALLRGGEFPCHATVAYDDDGDGDTSGASFCAGAAKSLLTAGTDNQMLRTMDRLGMVDLGAVEGHPVAVWDIHEWQGLAEGATGADPEVEDHVETCNTVDDGCTAPAGYGFGGGATMGLEPADGECATCGEGLCSNCADVDGNCGSCTDV